MEPGGGEVGSSGQQQGAGLPAGVLPAAPPLPALRYLLREELAVPGNRVAVLRDGFQAFPAMLDAVATARRSVHLETYIFNDDQTGRRFAQALLGAAARGVEVALLYDSLGSWRSGDAIFERLKAAGVKVLAYKPLSPWRRGWGWLRRDHRKLMVVDGATGFTGGINIGDQWAHEAEGGSAWRDTMVRLSGPAAASLDELFRSVWEGESKRQGRALPLEPRANPGKAASPTELAAEAHGVPVQILANREFGRRRAIRHAYRHAIALARRSVFIANAYFIPDRAILRSLRAARRRGVRVALLLPGHSDIRSVQWASRATYDRLLTWGIEILHWGRPVFHAKTAVIDGSWSTVGSYNLDTQSLRYNLEVTALVASTQVARELERMFVDDGVRCERVELAAWRRRPLWWRIPERICYALRAFL